MDSIERSNPSSTKQGSANPVGAYAKLVLQKKNRCECSVVSGRSLGSSLGSNIIDSGPGSAEL